MSKPKIQTGDIIAVRWTDAYVQSIEHYWSKLDPSDISIKSVGFFVTRTKKFLVIAQSIGDDTTYGCLFSIPLSTIRGITKLS